MVVSLVHMHKVVYVHKAQDLAAHLMHTARGARARAGGLLATMVLVVVMVGLEVVMVHTWRMTLWVGKGMQEGEVWVWVQCARRQQCGHR